MNRTATDRPRRPRVAARPSPESLERRLAMAVFTVNSFADALGPPAGTVTLRSAIQAADASPGPDTIDLAVAGTYRLATYGPATDNSAGELAVADAGDLTIQNTSGGTVTVDGGGLDRAFDLDPAGSAAPFTVTIRGLVIAGGFARSGSGGDGGGIRARGGAGVVLVNDDLAGDAATNSGGGVAMEAGGTGALTVVGSRFDGDRAVGGGGGGVAAMGSGAVTIASGSVFDRDLSAGSPGGGGAYVSGPSLAVAGSEFRDDLAIGGPGGGLAVAGAGGASVSGSLFEGDFAFGNGGGLAASGSGGLTVASSFFLGDTSNVYGGGLAAAGPSAALAADTIAGCYAFDGGGLVTSTTGTTGLVNCLLSGDAAGFFGGAIYDTAHALRVTTSTLSGDRAAGQGGGIEAVSSDVAIAGALFRGDAADLRGGALATSDGTLAVDGSRFTGNSASLGGAANPAGTPFTISDSTFDGNRADDGGALALSLSSTSALVDDTIAFNVATADSAAFGVDGDPGATLTLTDDTIDGNASAAGAGGVAQRAGTLVVSGTILAGNTSAGAASDFTDSGGTLTDGGGNLLGSAAGSGGEFGPGTIVGNPLLGPLVDNGGPRAGTPSTSEVVPTQALLPGSPAFGQGAPGAATTDERGFARPASPAVGAYQPQYAANASPHAAFVEDLYEVLFDRVADPVGMAADTAYLNNGGSPTTLVRALQATPEYLNAEASQLYLRYLGRPTSPAETAGVAAALKIGVTPEAVGAALIGSAEFSARFGGITDTFVEAAFVAALGRPTSGPAERSAWDAALAAGASRSAVGALLLASTEYLADLTVADFESYLGRDPSPAELASSLASARSGVPRPARAAAVLASSSAARA